MLEQRPIAPDVVENDPESVDLIALLRTLRRERKTVLAVILTAFVLSTAFAFLLHPKYTSEASFIPPDLGSGSGSMAMAMAGSVTGMSTGNLLGGLKSPGDLYSGILKSRSIADHIVTRFDLVHLYRVKKLSDAENILGSNTSVEVDPKSTIVTLSVTADSPQLAHDIAASYMETLRDTNGRLALGQASQRRLFFGQQLEQEKDALENAEVELKKTEEQNGLISPSGQTEAEIKTIAETQAQIAVRKVELASLRQSATEQNPDVIRLQSEIGNLEGQLTTLQKGKNGDSDLTIPTSKVPQVQLDYVRKQREVKYHEALFEMLSRQYEAARLDESREAPVLQVLDSASYPDIKSGPRRTLIVAGGSLFGLIAGCAWVLVRDPMRRMKAALA